MDDTLDPSDNVAMITGRYPAMSMTFVDREVRALRAMGCAVTTFALRAAPSYQVKGRFQHAELARTHRLSRDLYNAVSILKALAMIIRQPRQALATSTLAIQTRPPGLRGIVLQSGLLLAALHFGVHLRAIGATHIHNHLGDTSGTVAMLASKMTGLPFSMTLHGPEIFDQADRWHLRRKIENAGFVVCISADGQTKAKQHSDPKNWDKLKIVRCGIEREQYAPQTDPPKTNSFLYVGRLEARKGIQTLLHAMTRLPQGVRLMIVGTGPEETNLKAFVAEHGLGDAVSFFGIADETQIASLLQQHDILVVPSLSEGLPAVIMEAFASARPVIATAVDGIPELVHDGKNGLLVPPDDPAALADAMTKLVNNEHLRMTYAKNGFAQVMRDHDTHKNVENLMQHIQSMRAPSKTFFREMNITKER